jgi:hypothetical protein
MAFFDLIKRLKLCSPCAVPKNMTANGIEDEKSPSCDIQTFDIRQQKLEQHLKTAQVNTDGNN